MNRLGLYLHIPFCKRKCAYCDFYSLPSDDAVMDAYADALCAELAAFAPQAEHFTVDSVYFGGGTPSFFGFSRLLRVWDTVRSLYTLAPDAEVTAEANPDTARDRDALRAIRQAGINRISLGMQSADDAMLASLGRLHRHAETAEAVRSARDAGFANLSLDLMYGLPQQSMAQWLDTLRAAIELSPEHLSCYALKAEAGTPMFDRRGELPDGDAQCDAYLAAVELLGQNGYEQYEISNFARPGFASRHNIKYWTLAPYRGFGPGAHSDFLGRRFAYARDLNAYLAGKCPKSEDRVISPQERDAERVMLSLRTVRGLSESELSLAPALPFLRECAAQGLAEQVGDRWHLTPRGFFVSNAIILRVQELLNL